MSMSNSAKTCSKADRMWLYIGVQFVHVQLFPKCKNKSTTKILVIVKIISGIILKKMIIVSKIVSKIISKTVNRTNRRLEYPWYNC